MTAVPAMHWIVLGALALLLLCTAAMSVAARALNRIQRRLWANGGSLDSSDEGTSDAVEAAFISVGLARQTLLLLFVMRLVTTLTLLPGVTIALAAVVALLAFMLIDKLLAYWLVASVGAEKIVTTLRPLYRLERLLFGAAARYLQRTVRRAKVEQLGNGDSERGDLGAFLDIAGEEGLVTEHEEALLRGVAEFEDTVVREVMTPRVDVVAIESNSSLNDLLELIAEHRLSRIPLISGDLDHVVGIVNLKDLVAALGRGDGAQPLTGIVRPAHFVPESKRVSDLLKEFQRRREQMAIVADEYGGTAGLVTLEDVLEEIVGEIQDEDETEEELIESRDDGVLVSGKAEIADLADAVGAPIEEGEFHTVGGLVFTQLGRVPVRGESFEHSSLRFEVLDADERRVHRVLVRPAENDERTP